MKTIVLLSIFAAMFCPGNLRGQVNRVGIGTTTPSGKLQINHLSSAHSPTLVMLDSAEGIGPSLQFIKQGSLNRFAIIGNTTGTDANQGMTFLYCDSLLDYHHLWLKPNGALGLGTNSPQARIQINHRSTNISPAILVLDSSQGIGTAIDFRKQGVPKSFRMISKPADPDQDARFAVKYSGAQDGSGTDNANFILTGAGRAGFGANNPQGRLQINNKSGSGNPSIVVFDSTDGTGTGVSFRKQASNSEFIIASDGANMYYNPKEIGVDKAVAWSFLRSGQTGFGTASPLGFVQLNHKGSALQPGLVLVDSTGGNGNRIAFRKQGSNRQFRIRTEDFGGQELELFSIDYTAGGITHQDTWDAQTLTIKGNGRVGIGTAAANGRLQINNKSTENVPTMLLMDSSSGAGNMITFRKEGINRSFRMNAVTAQLIQNSTFSLGVHDDGEIYSAGIWTVKGDGKVGINNNSPAHALDVTGDLNITGKLKLGGNLGVAGQVLTSNGNGGSPAWQFPIAQPSGFNAFSDTFTVPAATVMVALPPNKRFDNQNDYDVATGDFVAPQTSGYALNAHVAICAYTSSGGAQTMHWVLEIVSANNTPISKIEKMERVPPNSPGQCAQFSISSIQKLNAGQKVRLKVRHNFNGGLIRAIVDEFSAHRLL